MKEIILTHNNQRETFRIEAVTQDLFIECIIDVEYPIYIKIINPEGRYIGEVHEDFNKFPNFIYYSKEMTTLNGLQHQLIAGTYSIEILSACSTEELAGKKVTLTVLSDLTKKKRADILNRIEKGMVQDYDWFNEIELEPTKSEARYYKGDFHGHTTFSDGNITPDQVSDIMQLQNMEFMALTEHNTVAFGFKETGVMMILSFELTLPSGHMNIHNVKSSEVIDPLSFLEILKDLNINKVIHDYVGKSNVSINHMFLEPWEFCYNDLDLSLVNTIEIICDPTYPTSPNANKKAVAFLDYLWCCGIKIYGIGGSDSHQRLHERYEGATMPSIYGDPATYVYSHGLSVKNIMEGVKNGNMYVSRFVVLDITIDHGQILPGSKYNLSREFEYRITTTNMKQEMYKKQLSEGVFIGRFIINGAVVQEQVLKEGNRFVLKNVVEITKTYMNQSGLEYVWIRFGLYDQEDRIIAYVNPIYYGSKECSDCSLKMNLKEFNIIYD